MTARLVVDLTAFIADLRRVRGVVAPARHMLVVKDDAYGHGLERIVRAAAGEHVGWYGAFDMHTAVRVRELAGPSARIVAWTVYDDADVDAALDADIDLGLGTRPLILAVAARARARRTTARVHLKIDTGLHRNGIRPEEWQEAVDLALSAQRDGALAVTGVWSHIAEASDDEDDRSRRLFLAAVDALGAHRPLRHLAASAAAFARPEFRFDMVRIGAYAYGIRPAGGPGDAELGLTPIATLVATVTGVADDAVTVDVGFAHGMDSRLAGVLEVGTPAGTRRLTAVHATTATVDAWPGAAVGDDVALFGGAAPHSATDVAERLGTIGEHVLLRVSPRLPRAYIGAGD